MAGRAPRPFGGEPSSLTSPTLPRVIGRASAPPSAEFILLDNSAAERVVRARFWLAFALGIPALVGGLAVLSTLIARQPLSVWPVDAVGALVGIAVIVSLSEGFLGARLVMLLSVPNTISVTEGSLVGDFRRKGSGGYPIREIRFEDIRGLQRTRFLRLPKLVGRANYRRLEPIPDSPFFYLSEENFAKLEQVLADHTPE